MGLERAVKGGHLDASCQQELFSDLQKLVTEGRNADHATGLLLEFDQLRAVKLFLSPVVFTPASRSLHEALEALADRKVPVPRDRLLMLINELEQTKLEYPHDYALAEALRLLGQHRQPEDQTFFEARMNHSEAKVAEGASAGLLAWHGLEGFQQTLWDREKAQGFSGLSTPQKYYSAVIGLDGEVNNGGHSQYFVNSSGDEWREARQGLEAMGFKERVAIFREAIAKFGSDGPSVDRSTRQEQLAKIARQDDALFDSLDDRYYKCADVIDVLVTRYVIKNADAFR
jgi:hypothetical protein